MDRWRTENLGLSKLDKLERVKLVSELRAEGLTIMEIHHKLQEDKIVNKETGKPYALITIKKDVAEISKMYKEATVETMKEIRATKFQQLERIRLKAMGRCDYNAACNAIEKQCKLYGLYQQEQFNVNIQNNVNQVPVCNISVNDFIEAEPIRENN
jgi:DNA-binding transcriptional MerR regulator